jgi:hypothetical protein
VTCWNGGVRAPRSIAALTAALLAPVLLACALVLAPTAAQAARCTCQGKQTLEQQARAADVVFSGVLVRSHRGTSGPAQNPATVYEVRGEQLYQGTLSSNTVAVVSPRGDCDLRDMRIDHSYVFFVTEEGAELRADRCGGTALADDKYVAQVEGVLGAGTPIASTPPGEIPPPEFTKVAGAEPETLTRMAAPGIALALVGLLGLVVVRRAAARD